MDAATGNPSDIKWVSITTSGKRQTWPLRILRESIEYEGGKVKKMLLVSRDYSHVDGHYQVFDHRGNYLGKLDKDTMLLYAESIPHEDRVALHKQDAT